MPEQRKTLPQTLLELSEGVFGHSVDMVLWLSVYLAELSIPQPVSGQLWRAQVTADRALNVINYDVIKNAIITARRHGWIKKQKRHAWPEITAEGKRRLASTLPRYDKNRTWDGRMHVVTYDIPERRRADRALLRGHLTRLGCGRLQDSVWLTPYNPIDTLRSFTEERALHGTIIVSDLGKDGSIGEEDLRALVYRVYRLEKLNVRYRDWLKKEPRLTHWSLIRYLAILQDDPQLPFSLLPPDWLGEKAYRRVALLLKQLEKKV